MDGVLWYLLASTRGAETRTRILRAIDDRPRNANQLANALELDYTTVRHHLDVMMENNVVRKAGDDYGTIYLLSEQVKTHRDTLDEVLDAVGGEEDDS